MKDNTIVLIVAEVGLMLLGAVAMLMGHLGIAGTAAGAFVGLVAGHLNGTQKPKEVEVPVTVTTIGPKE